MVYDNKILLGLRSRQPLKDTWFTPGGRVRKNEPWQVCLRRIAQNELGYQIDDIGGFHLMGIWDHFYPNSSFDEYVSTHYVNFPHFFQLKEEPSFRHDYQHNSPKWFDLEEVANSDVFHMYMRNYAKWLIKRVINND
jgi:colanic acid biosynthesis protein WcaH